MRKIALTLLLFTLTVNQSSAAKKSASVTWYQSYAPCCPDNPNYDPDADTTECDDYSACEYAGDFAVIGHQSWDYVKSHDLVAFYDDSDPQGNNFMENYGGRTVRIYKPDGTSFTALIVDTCGNSDCDGCCRQNSSPSGYLIDIEYYTAIRHWGSTDPVDGQIQWELV